VLGQGATGMKVGMEKVRDTETKDMKEKEMSLEAIQLDLTEDMKPEVTLSIKMLPQEG
jgi:hypothetical protein